MTTHLAHRLPWSDLCEVLRPQLKPGSSSTLIVRIDVPGARKIRHWARCFVSAVLDFSATAKDLDDELDPTTWTDESMTAGGGGRLNYWTSIVSAYIKLNLLIADPAMGPAVFSEANDFHGPHYSWPFICCAGEYDGSHPERLATSFQRFYSKVDGKWCFKGVTEETLEPIKEHLRLLFQCLYTFVRKHPEQTRVTEENVVDVFQWGWSPYNQALWDASETKRHPNTA